MNALNTLSEWKSFVDFFKLTDDQQHQFERYFELLKEWSDMHNLTAIKDDATILSHHFYDSLYLAKFLNLNDYKSICDVGAGAGFPGLPLKILYPHLNLYLNEVNQKKVAFLETVVENLCLRNVKVLEDDFRNTLRKHEHSIDIFVARASLQVDELLRIFKPSSEYKNSMLIYWASKNWEPSEAHSKNFVQSFSYMVEDKERKLYLFKSF